MCNAHSCRLRPVKEVTQQLEAEGVGAFSDAFTYLLEAVESRVRIAGKDIWIRRLFSSHPGMREPE